MIRPRLFFVGALLGLLGACAPQLVLEPRVPTLQVKGGEGPFTVPQWVLPGNPLPLADDFESYPVGAVLTRTAPKLYGLFGGEKALFTITETLDPQNAITKAVRMERFGGAFLTTGAESWTNYRVSLEVKFLESNYWASGLLLRVFMNSAGSRALEFLFGAGGLELTKVLGEQRQVVAKMSELSESGKKFVQDKQWHHFEIVARSTGEVQFSMDGAELISWKDPDFRQGGLGFGVHDYDLLHLDNLEVTPLSEPSKSP